MWPRNQDKDAGLTGLEAVFNGDENVYQLNTGTPKYKSKYHLQLHSKYDLRI